MKKSKMPRNCLWLELPATEYRTAWDLQTNLVAARRDRIIEKDIFLCLEHPPVFTLGRRGGRENLTVSEGVLKKYGIPVIQVERGGNITFHGPGQLIVYPIVDLHASKLTVVDFVEKLEEVMIRTAAEWRIGAERNPANRGVWVGPKKIGSIGIAVRRGVSFHGLALNVNTDLEPFTWINPCGLEGVLVTSMKQVLDEEIPMEDVRHASHLHIREILDVELERIHLEDIHKMLGIQGSTMDREAQ